MKTKVRQKPKRKYRKRQIQQQVAPNLFSTVIERLQDRVVNLTGQLRTTKKELGVMKKLQRAVGTSSSATIIEDILAKVSDPNSLALQRPGPVNGNGQGNGVRFPNSNEQQLLRVIRSNGPILGPNLRDVALHAGWQTGSKNPKTAVSQTVTRLHNKGLVRNTPQGWVAN